jgi:heptaprenyl diphosphate synthase
MQSQDKLRIALFAACAIGFHILERLIPSPIPWLRLGLANIITLTAIVLFGVRVAVTITLIRVFLGSLFAGTFLGPAFVLSLGSGLTSTLVMGGVYFLFNGLLSPVGISLVGALFHNLTQLGLAYFLFIRKIEAILYIAPLILFLGTITGTVNGMASALLLKKIKEHEDHLSHM